MSMCPLVGQYVCVCEFVFGGGGGGGLESDDVCEHWKEKSTHPQFGNSADEPGLAICRPRPPATNPTRAVRRPHAVSDEGECSIVGTRC